MESPPQPPGATRDCGPPSASLTPLRQKPHPLHTLRIKRKSFYQPSALLSSASTTHSSPPPPPPPPRALSPSVLSSLFSVTALQESVSSLEAENESLRHRIAVDDAAVIARLDNEVRTLRAKAGGGERDRDGEVEALEEELLRLRVERLDLLFVAEEWRVKEARLLRRLDEAERVRDALSAFVGASAHDVHGSLVMAEVEAVLRDLHALGGLSSPADEPQAGRVRPMDALDVLKAVKRVVLKLKAEADELRRARDAREDPDKVARERRLWEQRLADAERELSHGRRSSLRDEHDRLTGLLAQLRKELKDEKDTSHRLRTSLTLARARAEEREAEWKAETEAKDERWRSRVEAVEEEVRGERRLIEGMKAQLDSSMDLIRRMQSDREEREAAERGRRAEEGRERGSEAEVARLRGEVERLEKENAAYAAELSAFDEAFFEEIEDLKYRYAQAVETIQRMTEEGRAERSGGAG